MNKLILIAATLLSSISFTFAEVEKKDNATSATLNALDTSFAKFVEGASVKGAALVDFIEAQAPDVVRQLLVWKFVENFIPFLIGMLFLILFITYLSFYVKKVFAWAKNKDAESKSSDTCWVAVPVVTMILSIIVPLPIILNLNFTWLKIWLAPKVYLLEYLTSIVK